MVRTADPICWLPGGCDASGTLLRPSPWPWLLFAPPRIPSVGSPVAAVMSSRNHHHLSPVVTRCLAETRQAAMSLTPISVPPRLLRHADRRGAHQVVPDLRPTSRPLAPPGHQHPDHSGAQASTPSFPACITVTTCRTSSRDRHISHHPPPSTTTADHTQALPGVL
jgi:hypothetical protein